MKTCTRCREPKPLTEFRPHPKSADRLTYHCVPCINDVQRDRYHKRQAAKPTPEPDWNEEERRCTSCDTWKPWEEFPPRAAGRNGRSSKCRDCTGKARRDKRAANVETARARDRAWAARVGQHYRKRYGITRDQRDAMAAEQGGLCAACGKAPAKRLVVDHCHRCNGLRKLLCDRCNQAMHALDEPGLLELLLAYRDKHLADGCG